MLLPLLMNLGMLGDGGSQPAPETPATPTPNSGGYGPVGDRRRKKKDVAAAREFYGIPDQARLAIEEVARRQAERREADRLKQVEELTRELKLRRIAHRARYFTALAAERERLIAAELKRIQDENEAILVALCAACAIG